MTDNDGIMLVIPIVLDAWINMTFESSEFNFI